MGCRRPSRADALVASACANGLPTGGGLPAAATLTISATEAERIAGTDPADRSPQVRPFGAATAGHTTAPVGDATARLALCCATITPAHHHGAPEPGSLLARIGAGPIQPLLAALRAQSAVQLGRTVRHAPSAQRKALQLRDAGCAIPGCRKEAGYTQPHHITPWSLGGGSDLSNLMSLLDSPPAGRARPLGHQPAPPGAGRAFTITRHRR